MSNPVWVLSVDLQTKTATFQSGLADAARSARGSFNQITDGAKGMGEGVQQGAGNVRAALGLIDNTIRGNHAAAMADLVREFQNTQAVMAILPFAAVIGGIGAVAAIAVEAAEKIKEWREEDEKLNREQTKFTTTLQEGMNGLDDRLLQAGKRADELKNDHLGALEKELTLIDHAEMGDLIKSFNYVSKAADDLFKNLEGHWYTFGRGSDVASYTLEQFTTQYDALLSKRDRKGADDLLQGTLTHAQTVLDAIKSYRGSRDGGDAIGKNVDYTTQYRALAILQKEKLAGTETELHAHEALVDALKNQVVAAGALDAIKNSDKDNARTQTGNEAEARRSEAAKQAASAQLAINESKLAGERATANAALEIQHATTRERLESDLDFAARDRDIKLRANADDIAALNKNAADSANQLRALNEKKLTIEAAYQTQVSQLRANAAVAQAQRDLADYQAGQRDLIQATENGSSERLLAITTAMQSAEAKGLQETDFYRQLAQQKVEAIRKSLADERKLQAEADRERSDNAMKMALLGLLAEQSHRNASLEGQRVSSQQAEKNAIDDANREFRIKQQSLQDDIANLNKSGKDYQNQLLALQNRERQLVQQHENDITHIQESAAQERLMRQKTAATMVENSFAQSFLQVLERHQSFTSMMSRAADQLTSNLVSAAIEAAHGLDSDKLEVAKDAARWGFAWGAKYGGPAAPVLAPLMAGTFFAGAMAFEAGGVVPGTAKYDSVPAMLTPGEGVVPGGVMDGLSKVAGKGGFDGGKMTHVHLNPIYNVQAIDGKGMKEALQKHTAVLHREFKSATRKMNR